MTLARTTTFDSSGRRVSPQGWNQPAPPPPQQKPGTNSAITPKEARLGKMRAGLANRYQRRREEKAATLARNLDERRQETVDGMRTLHLGNVEASRIEVEPGPDGNPAYQRPLNEDRVIKIALEFDPGLFSPIIVANNPTKPGFFYMLDGQHHLAAGVLLHGERFVVPIQVVEAKTQQERARLFDLRNAQRVGVQYAHRFGVRLQWGEEEAAAIQRVAALHGLRLRFDKTEIQDGEISCLGALSTIYRVGGEAALGEVLGILKDAWGMNKLAYREYMIKGVFGFMWRFYGQYQRDRLMTACRLYTPEHVYREAIASGIRDHNVAVGYTLHTLYNHGVRTTPRLPDFTISKSESSLLQKLSRQYREQLKLDEPFQ